MTATLTAPRALRIGAFTISTPVVLAPMAGITNAAFRRLCREYGAGLYVSEMITSRALLERTPESMRLVEHAEDENPRSVQLYGVDPATVAAAVKMLVDEDRADHIDLNFGCPVPKVTRRGGGAALPWKLDLFTAIVRAAVEEASRADIPVTVKMRKGIDDDHLTFLDAGRIARDAGVAAVALHARTAADFYSGVADWRAIAALKDELGDTVPVLGNGDIWCAEDALDLMDRTGCDGVVIGRGCQGRPWLFGDLANAFAGDTARFQPGMREVAATVYRHAELMIELFGEERRAMREIRKHIAWYFKGYPVGGEPRRNLALVETLAELGERLDALDLDEPYPGDGAEGPRGRSGSPKEPKLPDGWLAERTLTGSHRSLLATAELGISGG